jgi:hypothetical protein
VILEATFFVEHKLEGMSVGVAPPFVDWTLITETRAITHDSARRGAS